MPHCKTRQDIQHIHVLYRLDVAQGKPAVGGTEWQASVQQLIEENCLRTLRRHVTVIADTMAQDVVTTNFNGFR